MPVFHSQFKVQASIETVFAFHRNARNLPKIQPPFPRLLSLCCPGILNVGDIVEVELGPFPRQSWKARVEELVPPHDHPARALMVDTAIQGPFPFFRHRHAFQVQDNSTWIKDSIDFDPPWGNAGWFFLPGIQAVLHLIFFYRHIQTRRLLEK